MAFGPDKQIDNKQDICLPYLFVKVDSNIIKVTSTSSSSVVAVVVVVVVVVYILVVV